LRRVRKIKGRLYVEERNRGRPPAIKKEVMEQLFKKQRKRNVMQG
jgi:hypothetical protein